MTTSDNLQTIENLQAAVWLVSTSVSFWRGNYQLRDARVVVDTVSGREITMDDEQVTKAQVRLLSKRWRDAFNKVTSDVTRMEEKYTLSFPGLRGARLVPRTKCYEYLASLDAPKQRLTAVLDEFCENFAANIKAIEASLPAEVWQNVRQRIPATPELFRAKARISTIRIQLNTDEDPEILDDAELAARQAELRQHTIELAHSAVEQLVKAPREELAKAVSNLGELIARDGRVTSRSFQPVRAAIEKLQMFEFMADETLLQDIQRFSRRLDTLVPSDLNNEVATNNGLMTAIGDLQTTILDAERMQADMARFGQAPRRMKLN